MSPMRTRLYWVTILVLMVAAIPGFAASGAGQSAGAAHGVTATAVWEAPAGRLDSSSQIALALAGGAETGAASGGPEGSPNVDEATVSLVWWSDASGWFPVWRAALVAAPGVIRSGDVQHDPATGRDSLQLGLAATPSPGNTYALSLSYDPVQGALGARIFNRSTGNVVAEFGVAAEPGLDLSLPSAVARRADQRETLAVTVDEFFTPMGVRWALARVRGEQAPLQLTEFLRGVEAGDVINLDFTAPVAMSGEWRLVFENGEERAELARFSGSTTKTTLPVFTVPGDLAGPFTMRFEYLDGGRLIQSQALRLVAGSAAVTFGEPVFDRSSHVARVHARYETTVPLAAKLGVVAKVNEIVWNSSLLKYEEVPAPVDPVGIEVDIAPESGSTLEFSFEVPLPEKRANFKLQYDVVYEPQAEVPFAVRAPDRVVTTEYDDEVEFTVVTYNVWGTNEWPRREAALGAVIEAMQPDILGLQEFKVQHRQVVGRALPNHRWVDDLFIGWFNEGNIYWSTERFELVGYGAEDVSICESQRRLFWVRLRVKETGKTLLVGNAHYTWGGHSCIQSGGAARRVQMARLTLTALERLAAPDEPVIFMGDLNESGEAIRTLRAGGLRDSVGVDGEPLKPTYPADPRIGSSTSTIDWQFHAGPIRAVEAGPVDFFLDGVAPSDHKPVLVKYRM